MYIQPELNESDWSLLLDLLENERRNLPPEIHHTDAPQMHEDLQQRLKKISDLIERIRPMAQPTA